MDAFKGIVCSGENKRVAVPTPSRYWSCSQQETVVLTRRAILVGELSPWVYSVGSLYSSLAQACAGSEQKLAEQVPRPGSHCKRHSKSFSLSSSPRRRV